MLGRRGIANGRDRAGVIVRSKNRRPGNDGVRAGLDRLPGGSTIFSAINLNERIEAARVADLAQTTDLGQHLRQEFLAAEARIDGHDENDIAEMQDVFDQLDRARRAAQDAVAEVERRNRYELVPVHQSVVLYEGKRRRNR